jgi:hypothetical protein
MLVNISLIRKQSLKDDGIVIALYVLKLWLMVLLEACNITFACSLEKME